MLFLHATNCTLRDSLISPLCVCVCSIKQSIAETLESNIKTAVANAINQRCACDFHEGLIDMGEMSCHFGCSSECQTAVYRFILLHTFYFYKRNRDRDDRIK